MLVGAQLVQQIIIACLLLLLLQLPLTTSTRTSGGHLFSVEARGVSMAGAGGSGGDSESNSHTPQSMEKNPQGKLLYGVLTKDHSMRVAVTAGLEEHTNEMNSQQRQIPTRVISFLENLTSQLETQSLQPAKAFRRVNELLPYRLNSISDEDHDITELMGRVILKPASPPQVTNNVHQFWINTCNHNHQNSNIQYDSSPNNSKTSNLPKQRRKNDVGIHNRWNDSNHLQATNLFTTVPNVLVRKHRAVDEDTGEFADAEPTARFLFVQSEVMLPSYGKIGDTINELTEVMLNILSVFFYRDADNDCASRLLCQSNRQAASRGSVTSFLAYTGSLLVSLWLQHRPVSDSLQAMREGRQGTDCLALFPDCDVVL